MFDKYITWLLWSIYVYSVSSTSFKFIAGISASFITYICVNLTLEYSSK